MVLNAILLVFHETQMLGTFPSPFDNMDTVEGIRDCADLMASGFDKYFDDKSSWEVINEYAPRSTEIRNKIVLA